MAVTAWPLGVTRPSLPRINFRWPRGVDDRAELSRQAEIERAFRAVDTALIQIDNRLNASAGPTDTLQAQIDALTLRIIYLESTTGAFGAMRSTLLDEIPNITNTWQKVVAFNQSYIPNLNVFFNITDDSFIINKIGLYLISLELDISYEPDANNERVIKIRLRNTTTNEISNTQTLMMAEKSTRSDAAQTVLLNADAGSINTPWILEISANPTVTSVTIESCSISAVLVGAIP
jgi:hypothetical protein